MQLVTKKVSPGRPHHSRSSRMWRSQEGHHRPTPLPRDIRNVGTYGAVEGVEGVEGDKEQKEKEE
jgi:hypothetical protein